MKKPKLNLTCFRAFKEGAEFHIVAPTKDAAKAIADRCLGKDFLIFAQIDSPFTHMLLSKRSVGFMNTSGFSDKNMQHDTRLIEGRKLHFNVVKCKIVL